MHTFGSVYRKNTAVQEAFLAANRSYLKEGVTNVKMLLDVRRREAVIPFVLQARDTDNAPPSFGDRPNSAL